MRRGITGAVGVLVCALWILGANPALAGEVNGKGKPIPGGDNGRSICSFSGQQDNAEEDAGFFRGDRVQNWGQVPKAARAVLALLGLHPGEACNPNTGEGEPD
jgi:hypothetical protein